MFHHINWLNEASIIVGDHPPITANSQFRATFGVTPAICDIIWESIVHTVYSVMRIHNFQPRHLLWGLLFLKQYGTERIMAQTCHASERTYRKWTKVVIVLIAGLMNQVVGSMII